MGMPQQIFNYSSSITQDFVSVWVITIGLSIIKVLDKNTSIIKMVQKVTLKTIP